MPVIKESAFWKEQTNCAWIQKLLWKRKTKTLQRWSSPDANNVLSAGSSNWRIFYFPKEMETFK